MSEDIAISAANVSKAYRIWESPASRVIAPLQAGVAGILPSKSASARWLEKRSASAYRDFYALSDISLTVRKGESVGIVGRNGSGKSTLLQLIAGTLQPSAGSIKVNGRVAALLELGAGFNPDFTGRENIFLSGAILGMAAAEVERRFDEIAAFADIGAFIEQPVKTYSSGMMMRLAFAVNTCVDPDILIVDEALSVGDAPFQAKCFRRLRQLTDKGVSLLFVSHDVGTVRSICTQALWLKSGRTEMWGEAKAVAKMYERFCWQEQGVVLEKETKTASVQPEATATVFQSSVIPADPVKDTFPPTLLAENAVYRTNRARCSYGTGHIQIVNLVLANPTGELVTTFDYAEVMTIWMLIEVRQSVSSECVVSFLLRDLKGQPVLATQDVSISRRIDGQPGQRFVVHTTLPLPLHHQKYVLHTAAFGFKNGLIHTHGNYDFNNAVLWDVVDEAIFLEVRPCAAMPLSGPVHLDRPVEISAIPPAPYINESR